MRHLSPLSLSLSVVYNGRNDEIFKFEIPSERFQLPRGRLMADGKERLIKRPGWPYHDIKHFRGGQERMVVAKVVL